MIRLWGDEMVQLCTVLECNVRALLHCFDLCTMAVRTSGVVKHAPSAEYVYQ